MISGVIQLAEMEGVYIAGDDFKSGQTKYKSVLVDFLVGAGIKPTSIVSYNHLGNNDGKNLSSPKQFRSKEISKSNVVDDMVESNKILYADGKKPDHTVRNGCLRTETDIFSIFDKLMTFFVCWFDSKFTDNPIEEFLSINSLTIKQKSIEF